MKNKNIIWAILLAVCTFTACMDKHDAPPTDVDPGATSPTSVGEVNTTIDDLKSKFVGYMSKTRSSSTCT